VIPVQDVVPTGRIPVATLALIAVNLLFAAVGAAGMRVPPPFDHAALLPFLFSLAFLWLFGDNVEARLGWVALLVVYLIGGWLPGLGASGAVTAVIGSYFVMLPHSRVLTLVPAPSLLVEVPDVVFLSAWAVVHVLHIVAAPRTMWMFVAAFLIGAAAAWLRRPHVRW
jgi:membrane associated rhomboid family serine protease